MGMVIAGTGHRPDKLGGYDPITYTNLTNFAIRQLKLLKPRAVISGMALGWDIALAEACTVLDIPFIAAVPFYGQERRWTPLWRKRYLRLLTKAERIETICKGDYAPEKMQRRNEWMVNHCDKLLALHNGSEGGTANCVRYATSVDVPILNVWQDWLAFVEEVSNPTICHSCKGRIVAGSYCGRCYGYN